MKDQNRVSHAAANGVCAVRLGAHHAGDLPPCGMASEQNLPMASPDVLLQKPQSTGEQMLRKIGRVLFNENL